MLKLLKVALFNRDGDDLEPLHTDKVKDTVSTPTLIESEIIFP